MAPTPFTLRPADPGDIPPLSELITISVRALSAGYYSPRQIDAALSKIFGVDSQLIADGTYFVAEIAGRIVGAGGWSRRQTLFGGDQRKAGASDDRVDPATMPGKIRAFYVHPDFARRGIARALLVQCESAARAEGFRRLELMATLPGAPLYSAMGYTPIEPATVDMGDGLTLPGIRMEKTLLPD